MKRSVLKAELLTSSGSVLGEGPVWDPRLGIVWWLDITAGILHATHPISGLDRVYELGGSIGAVGVRRSGGLVAATANGFATFDIDTATLHLRRSVEEADTSTRMNDGKVDPQGRFWAGTMDCSAKPGRGTLYRLDRDWTVTPVLRGVTVSNGLDWLDDGDTMLYIDTPLARVDRLELEPSSGTVARRSTAFLIPPSLGLPDGLAIDAEGGIWVALWGGWAVCRFAPDGTLLQRVMVPVSQPTSIAFGGEGLDLLFITSAREDLSPSELRDQPHAGDVFVCRPGPIGRQAAVFEG